MLFAAAAGDKDMKTRRAFIIVLVLTIGLLNTFPAQAFGGHYSHTVYNYYGADASCLGLVSSSSAAASISLTIVSPSSSPDAFTCQTAIRFTYSGGAYNEVSSVVGNLSAGVMADHNCTASKITLKYFVYGNLVAEKSYT